MFLGIFRFLFAWLVGGLWGGTVLAQPTFLYSSPHTTEVLRTKGLAHADAVATWRRYLKKYGSEVREISRTDLLTLAPAGPSNSVLILPSVLALDAQERQAISRLAQQGISLMATGLTGSLDASGKPVGLDFLHTTFRIRTHGEFSSDDGLFLMPFGDSPITWPIPAGRRTDIGGESGAGAIRVEAQQLAAVMMGWDRVMDTKPHGVLAYNENESNRVVYLGLPESGWPIKRLGQSTMQGIVDASLAWLRRKPQAYKADWPDGRQAAHLIEMDTEDKFFAATNLADDLERYGFRGTFYSLTSEAVKHPEVVRDLLRRGHEIAYHADVHFGFRNLPSLEQDLRIQFMTQQMRSILGDQVALATGFRAPTESYDHTTEQLLRQHGLLHHAADPAANEDRLPFFSIAEPGVPPAQALVVLPRTQWDDVNFTYLRLTADNVSKVLAYDLDLNFRSGAFSLLSVHSQYYVKDALMYRVMGEYVKKVASYGNQLWVARGDTIAHWWRQRAQVRFIQSAQPDGINIQLDSAVTIDGLTIQVVLPARNATVTWVPSLVQGNTPRVRVQAMDPYRAAIVFEHLEPGVVRGQLRVN